MSKRVKRNTYLTYGHKFEDAGPIDMNFGNAMKGAFGGSGAGAIGSAVGGAIGGLIGGGYQSGAGDVFNKIGDIGSKIPGPWGAIIGGGAKILGGLTNAAFGSKVDQEKLNAANEGTATLNSFKSNAESFDDIKGVQAVANVQDAYKGGWFAKGSARRKNEELRRQRAQAMSFADRSVENNVENLAEDQMNDMLSTYAAFGGPLHTNGADWNTGITIVDNGGSHESNPLEGVPMGIAPDGTPNLVEEGEVIFNDYVFSKRLKVPKAVREKYKLRGTKDLTFADAAKKAQKESEERPNDPISKRGLEAAMKGLMYEQEQIRQKREERKAKQAMFAYGGFARKYGCGGTYGHRHDEESILQSPYSKLPWSGYATDYKTLSDREAEGLGLPAGAIVETQRTPSGLVDSPFSKLTNPKTGLWMSPWEVRASLPKGISITGTTDTKGLFNPPEPDNKPLDLPEGLTQGAKGNTGKKKWWDPTYLRYAPVLGSALGVISDLAGWTNKPDYSDAEAIKAAADSLRDVSYTPIGDYMKYTPFDRLFYANQLGAQAGATRRNIMNTSGGNRGVAMAGLLGADYNTQNSLGNLYRQAEEYNLGQREKIATFNKDTNKFNAENDLKAQIANIDNNSNKVKAAIAAAELKDKINARTSAARSTNLSNLFNNIGDIGREEFNRNMIIDNQGNYYIIGRDGHLQYRGNTKDILPGSTSTTSTKTKEESKAFGGSLTIKRRRRK